MLTKPGSIPARLATLLLLSALACAPAMAESTRFSKQSSTKKDLIKRILKRNALTRLPYASKVVVSSRKASSSAFRATTVSGTPPTLASIPGSPIKSLFWREGVVDAIASGNADHMQCGEFFAGQDDGVSGGMGACQMAESIGYTFADLVQSQTSLCYMKNFPSKKHLKAGAVSVVRGTLPGGNINTIFNTPKGSARVVKVNVSGIGPPPGQEGGEQEEEPDSDTLYLRVFSAGQNKTNGNLYEVEIWHCQEDQSVRELNHFSISNAGRFVSENLGTPREGNGSFGATVSGLLKVSGSSLKWDPSKSRTVDKSFNEGENSFKANIEIDTTIKTKSFDAFQGKSRKVYTVTNFSGSDVTDVRFTAGAYIGAEADGFNFLGAAEYRDSYYAAAPASSLLNQVKSFDFESDAFFSSGANVSNDFSGYDCGSEPDIELNLDMSNPAMKSVQEACEFEEFRNMHFCHDSPEVRSAEENFGAICQFP